MTVLTGTDPRRETEVAVFLMRMALALLDRNPERLAATRLQHAIDTLERRAPGPPSIAELARHGFVDG